MTFKAKSHFKASLLESVHRLHFTMAFYTLDIAVDMSLMVKKDVLCHQVDLNPWRGRFRIVVSMFFLNPRMICDDVIVAVKTFFHRGESREIGITDVGMTISTVNLLHPGMHLMAERYGLLGADIHLPVCIEIIHKRSDEKSRAGGPEYIFDVFIHV